uniref:Metalloendopeptidase n=1 Tax=Parasteatoda tepidariorum TaxID=114398 RepID=A0A2L2Z6V3_PARTP
MNAALFFIELISVTLSEEIQLSPDQEEDARFALQNPDLYDGDLSGIDGSLVVERFAFAGDRFRWPIALVPFIIVASFSDMLV